MCNPERRRVLQGHGLTEITRENTEAPRRRRLVAGGFMVATSVTLALVASVIVRGAAAQPAGQSADAVSRREVLDTMKRATTFMVEKVSTRGGYVWSYLPDFSRRWGELEARDTMIWIQPPGTPVMGHLFLDAYHATADEYYYQAAEGVAAALTATQLESGGWNYVADFAGERSLRDWYNTVGRNAWRLEEFQFYGGNGTFDDAGTAESAKFLLRLYLEKRHPKYRSALDKAIGFILASQYPVGGWPQRYPRSAGSTPGGTPHYASYITFNDDVAGENIAFLISCYQALGETRLLDAITRGMNAFVVMQQPGPQAGWALQYTTDLKPAGARTYEPLSLVTHTTATNVELMIRFYRVTGEAKFLARIPEAIAWLEGLALPAGVAPAGRTHPTFVEIGTNKPLYVHRAGSNVFNGRYFVDGNPKNTIAHYSSFRRIDTARLRRLYDEAKALAPGQATADSPLRRGASPEPLPRFHVASGDSPRQSAKDVIASLNAQGYWLEPLGMSSHPYRGDGSRKAVGGDFSQTYVGDETDTSPFPDKTVTGISVEAYVRNMSVLIRALASGQSGNPGGNP